MMPLRGSKAASPRVFIARFSSNKPPASPFTSFIESFKKGAQEDKSAAAPPKTETKDTAKDTFKETLKDTTDHLKGVKDSVKGAAEAVKGAAEAVKASKAAQTFTKAFQESTKTFKDEAKKFQEETAKTETAQQTKHVFSKIKDEVLDNTDDATDFLNASRYRPYQKPTEETAQRVLKSANLGKLDQYFAPNTDAQGVQEHRHSKWETQWVRLKDANPLFNKLFEIRVQYTESDNIFVRMVRSVTDKVQTAFSGIMANTDELNLVFQEIVNLDPQFDKEKFIDYCHTDMIPLLLESFHKGDLALLEKWCMEACFSQLKARIDEDHKAGLKTKFQVLDIRNVDILTGQMSEYGPVLIVTAVAHEVVAKYAPNGKLVDGAPDKVEEAFYAFGFCREELDSGESIWRVLDFGMHSRRPTI